MTVIPIDIVNHICEYAAQDDKLWYPVFDLNTRKVYWKINKYYKTNIKKNQIFYNSNAHNLPSIYQSQIYSKNFNNESFVLQGQLDLITNDDTIWPVSTYNAYVFPYNEKRDLNKIYVTFTLENVEINKEKKFSAMLEFEKINNVGYKLVDCGRIKIFRISLNEDICGVINYAWISLHSLRMCIDMHACMSLDFN